MTLAEAIHQIAVHPDAQPTPEAVEVLRDAMRRHPYFALPAALLLRTGHIDADEIAAVRARVAVLTADKEALASIAAEAGADPARFYPPEPVATPVSTESAIDTFLDTYGSTSPEEEALLERLIFNPVPDYADILAAETPLPDAATDAQDELIDAFLKKKTGRHLPPPPCPSNARPQRLRPPCSGHVTQRKPRPHIHRPGTLRTGAGNHHRSRRALPEKILSMPTRHAFCASS